MSTTSYSTLQDTSLSAVAEASPIHALDCFCLAVGASMENTTTSNTTSNTTTSHKGGNTMENTTTTTSTTTSNSNSKRNGRKASNSKRNASTTSKASAPKEASTTTSNSLPDTLPAVANAGISAKGMEQDASTSLLFQYHIRKGLEIYGGACSICQLYNYLRGDNPLRLEKDGSPKQDNLPRWRGLGSSKLFRANTQGTLLEYTNKVCSNGRIRSIVKAGPMLQEFPAAK